MNDHFPATARPESSGPKMGKKVERDSPPPRPQRMDARGRDDLVLAALIHLVPEPEAAGPTRTASLRELAKCTGLSHHAVGRALKSLESRGRVKRIYRGKDHHADRYRIQDWSATPREAGVFARWALGPSASLIYKYVTSEWQTTRSLAEAAGISRESARRELRKLQSACLIAGTNKSNPGSNRSTIWAITPDCYSLGKYAELKQVGSSMERIRAIHTRNQRRYHNRMSLMNKRLPPPSPKRR